MTEYKITRSIRTEEIIYIDAIDEEDAEQKAESALPKEWENITDERSPSYVMEVEEAWRPYAINASHQT